MARILIIDDDPQVRETLESLVLRLGHVCSTAGTLRSGLRQLESTPTDLVFLDVRLPDGNGLEALNRIQAQAAPPDVIVLTGQGDPEGAELAIQGGVWDYLVKPSPIKQIKETLRRALAHRKATADSLGAGALDLTDVVGESGVMRRCFERINQAGSSDSTVLITGETGTGKELMARTIHRNSLRASRAFVVVDCASLTETLMESILFGHVRGAFTGAAKDKTGLVKLADKGTLFLDEIGELPLSAQKNFLRVLQERRFRPVGASQEQESDFRLICATNRDLQDMVKTGEFRQDLFYRINTIHLVLPPLRERESDVISLARHHIATLCRQRNIAPKRMDDELQEMLTQYDWPGNVRELFNTVEQAFVLSGAENIIYVQHLPKTVRIRIAQSRLAGRITESLPQRPSGAREERVHALEAAAVTVTEAVNAVPEMATPVLEEDGEMPTLKEYKVAVEKVYLEQLMARHGGDMTAMLRISGLSRSHFYAMIKKHDLDGG